MFQIRDAHRCVSVNIKTPNSKLIQQFLKELCLYSNLRTAQMGLKVQDEQLKIHSPPSGEAEVTLLVLKA